MTTNPARDELADLIASVTIDTKSGDVLRVHPDGETPVFEGDQRTADALLANGYHKPRMIGTTEELDALPFESVIRDRDSHVLERWGGPDENVWVTVMVNKFIPRDDITLPATVLWEPQP